MKTLSALNFEHHLASEDEPDFTGQDEGNYEQVSQRKNATDYTEEIKQNEKESVSKLSVECKAEEVQEIQRIEDIPNYLNLLLIKLDRMPARSGMSGITTAAASSATLKAEELESLPDETLEEYKKRLMKELQENPTLKKCEVLRLKIRSLNQSIDEEQPEFNKVIFHSSEKFIKKFTRYRNKNIASANH